MRAWKKDLVRKFSFVVALGLTLGMIGCASKAVKASISALPISYVDTGNEQGIPIVLLHAFPLNQSMWDEQVDALRKTARVITLDVRGLGKSELAAPYTLEFMVDDLISLMDQLKIEKAVVCGLSMGGFVALRAVERNPERFIGLVLADTKSGADSDKSKLGRYQALKTIQKQGLSVFADSFGKLGTSPSTQTERPQIFARAKNIMKSNSAAGVQAALLALTSRTDTTADLSRIHIPTLIMHGEFDSVIPVAEAQSLHDKIKGSKLFIIPGAGHLSNLENPVAFNEQLLSFIAGFNTSAAH